MNMHSQKTIITIVAVAMICMTNSFVNATIIAELDSTDALFYKYEFDVEPTTQDLDSNGTMDFAFASTGTASFSCSDGILYQSTLGADSSAFYQSHATDMIWDETITWANGYTIEIRAKVNSMTEGSSGACYLQATAHSSSGAGSWLALYENKTVWGRGDINADTTLDSSSNTDGFHVFRLAQEPGAASFSVWRDGVLIGSELGTPYTHSTLNRVLLGDGGGTLGGDVEYDYIRIASGAYAPTSVPEPGTLALLAMGSLGLLLLRRKNA